MLRWWTSRGRPGVVMVEARSGVQTHLRHARRRSRAAAAGFRNSVGLPSLQDPVLRVVRFTSVAAWPSMGIVRLEDGVVDEGA